MECVINPVGFLFNLPQKRARHVELRIGRHNFDPWKWVYCGFKFCGLFSANKKTYNSIPRIRIRIRNESIKCEMISNWLFLFPQLFTDLSAEQVTAYLLDNPDFLERHIMKEVELEQLERWMIRRTQQAKKAAQSSTGGKNGRKTSLSR